MSKDTIRARQPSILVLLIAVAAISGLSFRPVIAYADAGPMVADGLDVLLTEVPLYSQLDNPGVEWTSCGPTSLAMALDDRGQGPTPQEVIAYATSHFGQDGEQLYKPNDPARVFTSPQHLYEIAQHYGDPVQGWVTDNHSARQQLRALLADGLPVIVDVTVALVENGPTAAHFVTVTGLDANNTIYLNDPYGEGMGGRLRAVAWEDFYWAWQNNGDGHVSGLGWWMVVEPPGQGARLAGAAPAGGGENVLPELPFSPDDLLIVSDPLLFHVDLEMCVAL
jgi:uncharacterized protein YvpB